MNKQILRLAVPNIISNISIPLIGMVDIAIAGIYGGKTAIGAMSIGTTIFNMIYWSVGFIRMGTSGLTAQALGARREEECMNILGRSVLAALFFAALIVIFQGPIGRFSLSIMDAPDGVAGMAAEYIYARIWAVPAAVSLFAIHGWFIGMQNSRMPMWVSIIQNIINLGVALLFVFVLDMGIAGIAWAVVVAQYSGIIISWILWWRNYGKKMGHLFSFKTSIRLKPILSFFNINKDIFIRTICIVTSYTFFTATSSRGGETILATNALLMQLFTLFSYMMDGFAYAAEAMTGFFVGARDEKSLTRSTKQFIKIGFLMSFIFIVAYLVGWRQILGLFSPTADVLATAGEYIWWVIAVPIVSVLPFLMDGMLLGATKTATLRNGMVIAIAIYFLVYYSTRDVLGNNAIWLAFVSFIIVRGVILLLFTKGIKSSWLIKRNSR